MKKKTKPNSAKTITAQAGVGQPNVGQTVAMQTNVTMSGTAGQ